MPESLLHKIEGSPAGSQRAISHITSLMPSLALEKTLGNAGAVESSQGVHALTIVARILNDPAMSAKSIGLPVPNRGDLDHVAKTRGDIIISYAEAWTVDGTSAEAVERKIEELIWMNVILYGIGGWGGRKLTGSGEFNADFLLMHLVTSSIFLHSLTAYLSPSSTSILLRAYFINSLGWWIARGRPALPISDFYSATTATPIEPGASQLSPANGTLLPDDVSPNPFLPILQSAIKHPDEHLCKCQRALAHFSAIFGTRAKGHLHALSNVSDPKARLEGAEHLDGSLFVRVASLTADRLGWMREGQEKSAFSFDGFFE